MDRPAAGGFLGLTAFQAEGCGLPLCGNAYEVSVTDLPFCVIGLIGILVISRYAAPPYPATPDFPPSGGQNKSLYAFLQRHGSMAKHP